MAARFGVDHASFIGVCSDRIRFLNGIWLPLVVAVISEKTIRDCHRRFAQEDTAMKKGICLGCVPGDTPEAKFALAAELGFQCVEVGTLRTPEERERYRLAMEQSGIPVVSVMNSDHWGCPLSDPDAEVRKKSIQCIIQSLDTAEALGADTVLVVPAVVKPDVTYEDAWQRSYETIGEVLPIAEEKKVALAVENVWNKFLLSPIEFADYVDGFESKWLMAYFDVGNIVLYGYPQHWIRTLGHRLRKVHIKGFHAETKAWVQLLEGSIDWQAVMTALKEVGYDDVLTAELRGAGEDPKAGTLKISQDMDHILSLLPAKA